MSGYGIKGIRFGGNRQYSPLFLIHSPTLKASLFSERSPKKSDFPRNFLENRFGNLCKNPIENRSSFPSEILSKLCRKL